MKNNEIQNLICETLIESLNDTTDYPDSQNPASEQDTESRTRKEIEFARGIEAGLKAKIHGGKFVMDYDSQKDHYETSFWRGYKKAVGETWWSKFNDKLTSLASRLGYSRTRM